MNDLEMTRLCAEAMGYEVPDQSTSRSCLWVRRGPLDEFYYDPLHDDAQAMALVKCWKIGLQYISSDGEIYEWLAEYFPCEAVHIDLNRAIVECVAKMQAAK